MRRDIIIKEKVALYYEINPMHLTGASRTLRHLRPRQIAMYLCHKHMTVSVSEIARRFGRDHATVLHNLKVMENLLATDPEIKDDVAFIEKGLPWMLDGHLNVKL